MSPEFEVEEHVLGLYSLEKCDSNTITDTILDILLHFGLVMLVVSVACYDGAAAMSGYVSGIAKRIQDLELRAVAVHCQMHSLNLAVQDTVTQIPVIRDFLHMTNDLINHMRDSPKRCAITQKVAEQSVCIQRHDRPLCSTRITMTFPSLDGLLRQATVFMTAS